MKKILAVVASAAIAVVISQLSASSQTTATPVAIVVASCGSPTALFVAGRSAPLTVNTLGQVCS